MGRFTMVKYEHYKYTVYIRGEGRKILDEIASKVNMTKSDIMVIALKLLKHFIEAGVGETAIYDMPNELWVKIYDMHKQYLGL